MILAAWLLLGAAPAEVPPALPSADEAARRVAACGFPERSLQVREDPLLEEEVVAVRAATPPPSDAQLGCAARASLATSVEIEFEAARTRTRYVRLYDTLASAEGLAQSRAWFAERGLLARLPGWDGTPAGLAKAGAEIERLCGLEPGSRLIVRFHTLIVPPEQLDPARITSDDLLCLTRAARAAGLPFGFIGHESYRPRQGRGRTHPRGLGPRSSRPG